MVSLKLLALGGLFLIYSSFLVLTLKSSLVFVLSLAVVGLLWFSIKNYLETSKSQQNEIYQLRKIKRNFSVFNFLSKPISGVDRLNNLQKFNFGNANAPVNITLIISPSCFHCHKAFNNAVRMMDSYPDIIAVNIIFNININNKENPFIPVVETLTEMCVNKSEKLFEAISDWHLQRLDLEHWKKKWKIDTISVASTLSIHEQYDWCLLNNFNYTPVIIINQKLLPREYEFNDLSYFINDLKE